MADQEPEFTHEDQLAEILKLPSTLPPVGVTLSGFGKQEDAELLGNVVQLFLRTFGTWLDLERLEGVTIAFDYAKALSEVDRGGFQTVAKPTQDGFVTGIAMAVPVIREGKPRSHLVLDAGLVSWLNELNEPNFAIALYALAHEAVHVHDLAFQDRAFPGLFGSAIQDFREAYLFDISHVCWQEYIACRLSARHASPEQTGMYEDTFCEVLSRLRDRGDAAIQAFRRHGSIDRLLAELKHEYRTALKYGSYLLGHIHGLQETPDLRESAPKAADAVQTIADFAELFQRFSNDLVAMHNTYGNWSGFGVFDPLQTTVSQVMGFAGIEFHPESNGRYYVNVPRRPGTVL